jgi:transposase
LEARRQRAVALLRAGRSYREVAETLNASVSSIVRWQQAYRQGGKVALRSKPTPGRPSRLGPVQRAELEALLSAGAQKAGYSTDQWTLRRVAELIEKRCRIRYGRTGVRKVLMQ